MEFGILGPLEVRRDGASLVVGRRRERALLAMLLVEANRVVPVDRLLSEIAALGGPAPTPAALQVYISRLRSALRSPGDTEPLITHPGGYRLCVDPNALDAARFDVLADEVRGAMAGGQYLRARELCSAALTLWRGPALLEYRDAAFAEATAARLEGVRLRMVEDRSEALLGCGEHRAAADELAQFTREHPLRERAWALRMRALYRDGRQAEALTVYQELRELLRDELGLEPSGPLRELELAVLRQDPDLDSPIGRTAGAGVGSSPPAAYGPVGIALPARIAGRADIRFVGRVGELDALTDSLKQVATGTGHRLALVAGEPGIGKTSLCSEFARLAADRGALVLYGRCEEGLGIPYQPFAEALTHLIAHVDRSVLDVHVAQHGGELAAVVPTLRLLVPGLPPPRSAEADGNRYVLFRAAVDLLASGHSGRPVLLVLDDLHWADTPTLLLLRYLVGLPEPLRVLVVGTYRPTELSLDHPLAATLAELHRYDHDRLELGGLADGDILALMETAAGHDLDATFVALSRRLHEDTGGNPFFVVELMRHLGETGAVARTDGRWRIRGAIQASGMPASLREVVGVRVARLGPRLERLLTHAAVIGRDFEARVLTQLCQVPEAELVAELERAGRAAIVLDVAPGRYSFRHAAIASTLYDALTPTRRSLTHRQVAEALEAVHGVGPGPRVAEIAHHWCAGGGDKALDYARWAGEAALAARAPEEAVGWFATACELHRPADDPRSHIELRIELGTAQRLACDPAHRETLLGAAAAARAAGETELMIRATLANNRGTMSSSGFVDAERVADLQAALAVSPEPTRERALLLATLTAELTANNDWPARRATAGEASALARRLGDGEVSVRVNNLRYFAIWVPETLAERLSATAESVASAGDTADPVLRHWVHRLRYYACADAGLLADMDRHLPLMAEAAVASGDPVLVWSARFNEQGRALLAGRVAEAEFVGAEAAALGARSRAPESELVTVLGLIAIRIVQGRAAEVVEALEAVRAQAPIPFLRACLARLYCVAGRRAEAEALLGSDTDTAFASLPLDFTWLYAVTAYAEAAARLADTRAAAVLYEKLADWHEQVVFLFWELPGSVALHLGMLAGTLGRFDDAQAHFAAALRVHERLQAPVLLAQTHLETARMLLRRRRPGDAGAARAALDAALALSTEGGFVALAREAADLIGS